MCRRLPGAKNVPAKEPKQEPVVAEDEDGRVHEALAFFEAAHASVAKKASKALATSTGSRAKNPVRRDSV
jgi:hypothetical protein